MPFQRLELERLSCETLAEFCQQPAVVGAIEKQTLIKFDDRDLLRSLIERDPVQSDLPAGCTPDLPGPIKARFSLLGVHGRRTRSRRHPH